MNSNKGIAVHDLCLSPSLTTVETSLKLTHKGDGPTSFPQVELTGPLRCGPDHQSSPPKTASSREPWSDQGIACFPSVQRLGEEGAEPEAKFLMSTFNPSSLAKIVG